MSSAAPSSEPEDGNNSPPKSPQQDLSASLVTNNTSPQSPSTPSQDDDSPPSQSSTPPPTTDQTNPTPPPQANKTPPPSTPPPKSTPPPNSPPPTTPSSPPPSKSPPPSTTTPPPSESPPPTSPSPPPPEENSGSSPSPPESSPPPAEPPPQNTPSQPSPPEESPPPSFVSPPDSGGNPVTPASPATPPPPSLNNTPGKPPLRPPVATKTPSPPSTVPTPPAAVQPGHPSSTNSSTSNELQFSKSQDDDGLGTGATVAITVVVISVILGILGTVVFFVWNRKKRNYAQNMVYVIPSPSQESGNNSDSHLLIAQKSQLRNINGSGKGITVYSPREGGGFGNSRSLYTYEELVEATNGFSSENVLGQGGFGFVYKGRLPDGRDVAVKQLTIGGGQGDREFKSEVEIISRIHHRHLVSLVGFCISESRRLLIYDYLPNNNLYFHLHGESGTFIDWAMRVKIAMGAARGIAYLHEDCHPRIIHRDIKSSNILLDEKFEARVSDFGLAKLAKDTNTHVTTRVMGTFGYMAPEYASSGKLTDKSDVYSYGVVLLELITGRKPLDSSQDESLVEWARPVLAKSLETQNFEELADPKLNRNYAENEMFRMVEAAAACVRHSSAKRPKMGQVVRALDSLVTADLTNGMRVGESELFSHSDQSDQLNLFRKMAFGTQDYSIADSWDTECSSDVNTVNSMRE